MSGGGRQCPAAKRLFEIRNRLGMHARAAALLVQTVKDFDAEITVSKDGKDANGKSILELMMLAAGRGSLIEVLAKGPDAEAALEAIEKLIESRFLEDS